MSRVRAFFVEEATECLAALREALQQSDPDPAALHATARKLRGSAQVARYGDLADRAGALEALFKGVLRQGSGWDGALSAQSLEMVEQLEADVAAVQEGRVDQDEREPMTDEQVGNEGEGGQGPVQVPLEALEYQGDAALARAGSLRDALENVIINEEPAGPLLDELFDLIQLGRK